jgi:adenylyltransferase/sulfurtransferase
MLQTSPLADKRVLLVGAGGLGSPAGRILARAGVGHLTIADDDQIEESNLQRQTLYADADVGGSKAQIAAKYLREAGQERDHTIDTVAREKRIVPDHAVDDVRGFDLVLEGSDNFATKFLVADACRLAGVPVVQAGAVRWVGWALATLPGDSACLRCVFEDVPAGQQDTCAAAGVVGPVVGVVGAIQGALALQLLTGEHAAAGVLHSYRGLSGSLRRSRLESQPHCPLCAGEIQDTELSRYLPPECAA